MRDSERYIDADELDRLFDDGEVDVDQYFDMENAWRPGLETRTVAIELPVSVHDALEQESAKAGTRVADLIESWVEDRLRAAV